MGGSVGVPLRGNGANRPAVSYLWDEVRIIINDAARNVRAFLLGLGVERNELSPFCRSFDTVQELLDVYEEYFNGNLDNEDGGDLEMSGDEDEDENDGNAERIEDARKMTEESRLQDVVHLSLPGGSRMGTAHDEACETEEEVAEIKCGTAENEAALFTEIESSTMLSYLHKMLKATATSEITASAREGMGHIQ